MSRPCIICRRSTNRYGDLIFRRSFLLTADFIDKHPFILEYIEHIGRFTEIDELDKICRACFQRGVYWTRHRIAQRMGLSDDETAEFLQEYTHQEKIAQEPVIQPDIGDHDHQASDHNDQARPQSRTTHIRGVMYIINDSTNLRLKGLDYNNANFNVDVRPGTSSQNVAPSQTVMEDPPPSDNVSKKRYPQLFTRLFCKHCNVELEHTIVEDQTKVLIARVFRYFECEYEELKKLYGDRDLTPLSKFRQRTALATGVSETTVLEILKEEEIRNAQKREESKRSRALKRSIQTKSSSLEDSSDDSVSDGGQPSNVQEARNEAEVETLVVKLEPECNDQEQVLINTGSIQVKAEPPDDDVNDTSETLAVTEPAAAKRRGRKSPRTSDVISPWQQTHGESSTAAASSSVRLTEELDESGLSEETEVKMEEIEIGEEGFS